MVLQRFRIGMVSAITLIAALAAVPEARAADEQSLITDAKDRIAKGDLKGAEIQLRNAVRANPNDAGAHLALAQVYIKMKNFPAAEVEARLARKNKGAPDQVDPVLGEALSDQGKYEDLFQIVQPDHRSDKAEAAVRVILGEGHLLFGELNQAQPLFSQAEQLDPQSFDAKVDLARLFLQKGDVDDAQAEVTRASALEPDDPSVVGLQGNILEVKGDKDGALAEYKKVLATHPDDIRALLASAGILLNQGKNDVAEKNIDDAVKLQPKNVAVVYLKGLVLSREGKLKEADALLTDVSPEFSLYPPGYLMLGLIKFALKEDEQATAFLSKYLARSPNNIVARRTLALIDLQQHHPQAAIDVLNPVVNDQTADFQALSVLAEAYMASGQRSEGLELYARAASSESAFDSTAQARLAVANLRAGDEEAGLSQLEKLAQSGQSANIAGPYLVVADLNAGKLADASQEAEALVKNNARDVGARYLLGTVRVAQHQYSDAEKIFQDVLKSDPKMLAAERSLAQLYMVTNREDDAKKAWQDVLSKNSADVPSLRSLAAAAEVDKNYPAAIDWLTKAQTASPKDPTSGLQLMQVYSTQKDWKDALATGKNLEIQFTGNRAVVEAVARTDAAAGDFQSAAGELQTLTRFFPEDAAVWEEYAAFELQAGAKNDARASLAKALALAPGNYHYMHELVDFDYHASGPSAALSTARSFAQTSPAGAALLAADVLVTEGKTDDAIAELQEAQAQHPEEILVSKIAQIEASKGQFTPAEEMLLGWSKAHEKDPAGWRDLATLYLIEHEKDKAAAAFERELALLPDDPLALNNLASIYADSRNPRAKVLAEHAYAIAPGPRTADTLGWALYATGDAKSSLRYLQEAHTGMPADPDVAFHLATALNATGDTTVARALLDQALRSNSDFSDKANAAALLNKLVHD